MRSFRGIVVVASAAALALPAAAAPPPTNDRRGDELRALRAKVKRLTAANKRLVAENKQLGARWAESLRREDVLRRRVAAVDACPITRPNGSAPPGPMFGAEAHGNGALWVGLWESNAVVWQSEADGSIDAKFGWWRGVLGGLRIEGRRLDAPAPPVRAHVPDGYGESGFQPARITFPTSGCWEVTGSVGTATLTFVTLVLGA
jgi:hypothetical protein